MYYDVEETAFDVRIPDDCMETVKKTRRELPERIY